MKAGGIYYAA